MVINFCVSTKNEMCRTCSMHENREENLIFDFNIDCLGIKVQKEKYWKES